MAYLNPARADQAAEAQKTADREQNTEQRGLALFGDPALPPGFDHLPYARPDAPKGGQLRLGATGTFDNLNPFLITGQPASQLALTYDTLMQRSWDEPFTLYPLIAESTELSPDRRHLSFRLNPAARFHDGVPITAEDVRFTIETLRREGKPAARRLYGFIQQIDTPDDHTIRLTLSPAAEREVPLVIAMLPVLPAHYWRDRDFGQTTLTPPPGSGPYRIDAVDPGRSITYIRVPDYWARELPVNRGLYNFDSIRVEYFRDDDVSLQAFLAHESDLRRESDPTDWAVRYAGPALDDGRLVLEALPHHRPDWTRALILNTRRPPFDDIRVREALDEAFDFEWLNRAVFRGAYKRIESYFPNAELAASGLPDPAELALLTPFADSLPPAVFGPAYQAPRTDGTGMGGRRANMRRALKLLKQAGWRLRDGKLVNAETGQPMRFEVLIQSGQDEGLVLEWQRTLARLGIEVSIRSVDATQFRQRLNAFDYDVVAYRWINSLSPGIEQRLYWSSAAAGQPGSRNYAGVRSAAVDALVDGIANATSRADLLAHAHALDRVLTHEHYAVPLYYLGEDLVAYWQPIRHPDYTPLYGMVIEAWWADQGKQP